jgi:hypothetical protein
MMKDPVTVLMDHLMAERGGRDAFSASELALCQPSVSDRACC